MSTKHWMTRVSPEGLDHARRDDETDTALTVRALRHIAAHGVPVQARNPRRSELLRARIDEDLLSEVTVLAEEAGTSLSDVVNFILLHVDLPTPDTDAPAGDSEVL